MSPSVVTGLNGLGEGAGEAAAELDCSAELLAFEELLSVVPSQQQEQKQQQKYSWITRQSQLSFLSFFFFFFFENEKEPRAGIDPTVAGPSQPARLNVSCSDHLAGSSGPGLSN